jgi:hypothetical protein
MLAAFLAKEYQQTKSIHQSSFRTDTPSSQMTGSTQFVLASLSQIVPDIE